MSRRLHKISGYRIINKKYRQKKLADYKTFDLEILEYWLKAINNLKSKAKKYEYKNPNGNGVKHFYLDKIINETSNYIFGKFKTGSYGTVENYVNNRTGEITYTKQENETKDDDVYFYIYKNTGVFLIGNDPNNAINASTLRKYFQKFEIFCEDYRLKFNEINEKDKQIYKNNMITIISLPPVDFFEEIDNLSKVNSASFTIAKENVSDSIDITKHLKKLDNDQQLDNDDVEIEVKIKNKSSKNFVKDIKSLFEVMNASEAFDGLKVYGKHQNGDLRTIKNKMPIRTFDCVLDYGTKTFPINEKEVESEFDRINKEETLGYRLPKTEGVIFIGNDKEIEDAIIKKCKRSNRKFSNYKSYRGILSYKNKIPQETN